jgi:hypothetical protein
MTVPGPFSQAFLDDMPYDPDVLLFEELLEADEEKSLIRVAWRTRADDAITRSQRNHPLWHPPHVAGALMVHATGMLGFVHAYHLLGLRHNEGWIGYGTHMSKASFRKLVPPGGVIECTCWAKKKRIGQVRHFLRYAFTFHHEGDVCYESEQAAMWMRVEEGETAQAQPALQQ